MSLHGFTACLICTLVTQPARFARSSQWPLSLPRALAELGMKERESGSDAPYVCRNYSWFLVHWQNLVFDFFFQIELDMIVVTVFFSIFWTKCVSICCSELKGILSPGSYPIKFGRKSNASFLGVMLEGISQLCFRCNTWGSVEMFFRFIVMLLRDVMGFLFVFERGMEFCFG